MLGAAVGLAVLLPRQSQKGGIASCRAPLHPLCGDGSPALLSDREVILE